MRSSSTGENASPRLALSRKVTDYPPAGKSKRLNVLRRLKIGLTRNWQLEPAGQRKGGRAEQLWVIAAQPIPTLDYYLGDLLRGEHALTHRVLYDRDVADIVRSGELPPPGTRVVLVRMPSSAWASMLARAGERVLEVVWLIDDDPIGGSEDQGLFPLYRERFLADYLRFRATYEGQIDRIWASTEVIAERFPGARVEVRAPRPIVLSGLDRPWVNLFYHGTSSHRREQVFLLDVFRDVQRACDHTVFEVVGDRGVHRMFRDIPRVRVLHPIRWPSYLSVLAAGRYDIGLVPLLDTPFNRARSGIKALEIAAIGARGILSRRAPYTAHAELPGMHLVGDSPSEWVEKILELAQPK